MPCGTMSTILRKDLTMSPFKHVKKHQLTAQVVDKRLQRCKSLLSRIKDSTLPNLVFSDEKKFDIEHYFNTQKDRVWSRNEDEGSRVVARKQCPASVMVWAAVTESGRSLLFFVDRGMKLNQHNCIQGVKLNQQTLYTVDYHYFPIIMHICVPTLLFSRLQLHQITFYWCGHNDKCQKI